MVKADNSARKIAMFKNGHLRLLMDLVGFRRIGEQDDPEGSWNIPSSISAHQLQQSLDLIKKSEFSPPVFDDGQEAGDFIRRKSAGAAKKRVVFDDEDNGIEDEDEEFLFPAGGPTEMKKSDALKALKKNRRRRRKEGTEDAEDNGPSDEVLKARAEARRLKELEKHRKIKSDLRIHSSDEEFDEERDAAFFAREVKIREKAKITIMKELLGVGKEEGSAKKSSNKRQSSAISGDIDEDEDDDDDDDDTVPITSSRKRHSSALSEETDTQPARTRGRSSSTVQDDDVLADSNEDATDTPLSSPHARPSQKKKRKVIIEDVASSPAQSTRTETTKSRPVLLDDDEDEDEDNVPVARPFRQRVRSGFIIDSSDEE